MQVGDEVEISIAGIGALTNTVPPQRPEAEHPMTSPVRVRFCPSPTGSPHVGLVRTALFNWAFARHHGGSIVFRMEDTDKERSTQESYDAILELWRWLGLDWDEGIEVGGPHGPYKQSERGDIYRDVLARLRESSLHLRLLLHQRRGRPRAARRRGSKMQGYDGFCRDLSAEQRAAFEAEGRAPIVRFRMPDGSITWDDAVRGDITFETENVPDFALSRANGDPLYTLVNPIDDALMEITHVLRGEDLLSSTPRQLALFEALVALGVAKEVPAYGHLPYVMGQGNKKLSKRDPEAHALAYREQGFLPEGLLNYLALLGWAIAADRDVFSLAEMVEAFDIKDVNPNPARFDLKKAEAINASHMRLLPLDDITHRVLPFLKEAGVVGDPVSDADAQLLELAMPLVARADQQAHRGRRRCSASSSSTRPTSTATRTTSPSCSTRPAAASSQAAYDALAGLHEWSTAAIEEALRVALIEGMELKPRVAFGPVRVAVTGAGSARRCSSRWSCSVASAACRARLQSAAAREGRRRDRARSRRTSGRTTTSCTGSGAPACGARWSAPGAAGAGLRRRPCRSSRAASPSSALLAARQQRRGGAGVLDVTAEATPAGLALLNIVIAVGRSRQPGRSPGGCTGSSRAGCRRWRRGCAGATSSSASALSVVALVASLGVGLLLPSPRRERRRRGQRLHHPAPATSCS